MVLRSSDDRAQYGEGNDLQRQHSSSSVILLGLRNTRWLIWQSIGRS
jgi:hypothetical protein